MCQEIIQQNLKMQKNYYIIIQFIQTEIYM